MGGLRKYMPVTFYTYAIGMMALSGVPLLAGFWSKDEILHKAHEWGASEIPYYMVLVGALLTAFYMTRQMAYVFFGKNRAAADNVHGHDAPHESPAVMTVPLVILAVCAVFIGYLGTPAWPWFESFVHGHPAEATEGAWGDALPTMLTSIVVAAVGIAAGLGYYMRKPIDTAKADPLQGLLPNVYPALEKRLFIDELYEMTIITWQKAWARGCDWLELWVWQGVMLAASVASQVLGWINRIIDELLINGGFNASCAKISEAGAQVEVAHKGNIQRVLRALGIAITVIVLIFSWGCSKS